MKADHFRNQHRDRLAEHGRLRLDTAYAPAEHREAIDHGRVAVRAYQGVRIGQGRLAFRSGRGPNRLGEVLQIDLMADTRAGRHDAEIIERLGPPTEEP